MQTKKKWLTSIFSLHVSLAMYNLHYYFSLSLLLALQVHTAQWCMPLLWLFVSL